MQVLNIALLSFKPTIIIYIQKKNRIKVNLYGYI